MPSSLRPSTIRRSTTINRWWSDRNAEKLSNGHVDIWEHAAVLYHGYEWQEAANIFANLARQISDRESRTICKLNAGLIQARLGDFADAAHTIESVAKGDKTFTLSPYLLGIMEWELGNTVKADKCFEACFQALHGGDVSYAALGLDFVLQADNVRRQLSALKDIHRFGGGKQPALLVGAIMPAECIFEAPPRLMKPRASTLDERHRSVEQSKPNKRHTSPDPARALRVPSLPTKATDTEEVSSRRTHPLPSSVDDSPTNAKAPSVRSPTALPDASYLSTWRRRPSTPYVPRNPRGEYPSMQELTEFLRNKDTDRLVLLRPRDAHEEQESSRNLANPNESAGEHCSATILPEHVGGEPLLPTTVSGDASGISDRELLLLAMTDSGHGNGTREMEMIHSPLPALVNGAEKVFLLRRHSGPSSAAPSPHFPGDSIHVSEAETPTTIRRLSVPVAACDIQSLELLLPTVYDPTQKAKVVIDRQASRRSIQLLVLEERRREDVRFGNLHTAASSTSDLFRDSMMTVDRQDVARSEALRALEGRQRPGRGITAGSRIAAGSNTPNTPLPPGSRVNRFASVVGDAYAPVRVATDNIFGYISRA